MHTEEQRTVISLGGSLFVPGTVDTSFIGAFRDIIRSRVEKGERFVIVVGGGKTCRLYQQAGYALGATSQEDADWIGIYTTRMHAEFMRIIFGDMADTQVVTDPTHVSPTDKPVVLGAGWKPGWSTDYVAVMVARTVGAQRVINLTNINYVYDKDPKTHPDAQPHTALSWAQYRAIIPAGWEPGLNTPFDPIASREAEQSNLTVVIMNGSKLESFKHGLDDGQFDGTVIS